MAMATASELLLPRLSYLPCISSAPTSSPLFASTCILPSFSWCARSLSPLVPAVLHTASGAGILRAGRFEATAPARVEETDGPNLPCDSCNGKGWLVCDFCKGQKTNVQVRANKFYRRCPSCRAAGVVICPKCKVFKCVSFPDGVDG